MKRTLIVILGALLLTPAVAALTWEAVLELAQQNGHAVKSAASQTESAKWSYYRSITPFLPQLSANASLGQTTSGTLAATSNSSSYGLSISQNLFSGLSDYYSAVSAKAGYDYYIAAQQKAISDFLYQVRQAYVSLTLADDNIALQKSILERRQNNEAMIGLLYENGKEDEGAYLRTKADSADAAYSLSSAQKDLRLATLQLKQLISAEVGAVEENPSANAVAKQDYQQLLLQHPAYLMDLKQLEQSELAYKQTISEFLPSVSLNGSYRKSGSDWPPTSDSNSLSLNLSYSFLPGGSNIADRIKYGAQYDQARQDFLTSRDDLRYALESAYESLKDTLTAEKVQEQYVKASVLRAEIARAKYLNGMIGYDEWDRIENDYISAQKSLISRKRSALLAEAAWYNSYGGYVK